MATLYGNQVGGGSGQNGFVLCSELWYDGNPANGYVTVHWNFIVWTKWSFTDTSNTLSKWGTLWNSSNAISLNTTVDSGSATSYPYWPAANRVVVESGSQNVNLSYGAQTYIGLGCSLTGLYVAGTSTASPNEIMLPAIPYSVPTAPTIGTNTRNSDTSNTIAWTNNATTAAPYTNLYVDRSTDGGGFVQVASLAGSATSYTDTTTSANHSYAYRVRVSNSAGSATSGTSGTTHNTPAAPSNCAAVKTGATEVTVTCTDNSNTETAFEWDRTADGGATWTNLGSTGAGVTTYVDSAAPGGTVAYRVRATRSALVSAYSATSNSVTTTTPPAAPTVTAFPVYSATGTVLRIAWTHNSLDGSAQSKADISYNFGGSETVYSLTGATAYYDIPITGKAATTVVTAKVRTYGLHANPGAYSGTTSTTLADTPAANITTPATDATVVVDVPLVVAWSYTDEFAQAGWDLGLYKSGVLVNSWSGTTETSQSIGAAYLEDDASFSLSLTVRSGSGFEATATRLFTTDYLAPLVPQVSAVWDPVTLSASVVPFAIANPAAWTAEVGYALGAKVTGSSKVYVCTTAGTSDYDEPTWPASGTVADGTVVWTYESVLFPATDHLALQRLDTFDGVTYTEVLADPVTAGTTIIDRTPRLGQNVTWRALAVAANGAYSTADAIVNTVAGGYYAVNFGDGDAELLKMRFNHGLGHSSSDDSETLTFAGRDLPVVYAGEHVSESVSLSATVMDDTSRAAMRTLRAWKKACVYRERDGYRANVKVTSVDDRPGQFKGHTEISLDMTVVE